MFFREEIHTKLPSYTRAAAASGFQVVARCDHILERLTWGDPGEYVSTPALKKMIDSRGGSLKRLAEIDKSLLEHDTALRDIYQKLLTLLAPPPEPPRRQIGFSAAS